MKSPESLANTDATRWTRILMVARYFWPTVRVKTAILAAMSLLFIIIASFFGLADGNPMGVGLLNVTSFCVIVAPLLFTVRPADEVFNSLPALPGEKQIVIGLFSFILFPIAVTLPGAIYLNIFFPGCEGNLLGTIGAALIHSDAAGWFLASCLISNFAQIAIGLWAAFSTRGSGRTIKTLLALLGTVLLNGMTGFVLGFISAFCSSPGGMMDSLSSSMTVGGPYIAAFWAAISIFAFYKAMRAIARRQV